MHLPVLLKEILQYLDLKSNENFIDCTVGDGGHALAILQRNRPRGKVLGIDRDPQQIERLKYRGLEKRLILASENFANLKKISMANKFLPVQGILFDLGMSSWHLEESGRGFSFLRDEPLLMTYSGNLEFQNSKFQIQTLTAGDIVNRWPGKAIEKLLREYGEERFAKKIAEKIVQARKVNPIKNTFQLIEIVKKATPKWYHRQRIHSATRTFQALRIAVNDELSNLEKALPQALELLAAGGRIAVISFHSLEDRIVKNFFRNQARKGRINILTKKPIVPSKEELKNNPRARSAKLRAAIKI